MTNNARPAWVSESEFKRAAPSEVFFNLPPHTQVLHIGGHLGREAEFYKKVTFVEPIPKYAKYLEQQGYTVIEGAVCGENLYITSYDQGSSVLPPLQHRVIDQIKVKNYSLEEISPGHDMLVIDAQGSELNILKSGELHFQYIIVEASVRPRYQGAANKKEIEDYLTQTGYQKTQEYRHGKHDIYDIVFEKII